jgi:hypothetical protein
MAKVIFRCVTPFDCKQKPCFCGDELVQREGCFHCKILLIVPIIVHNEPEVE